MNTELLKAIQAYQPPQSTIDYFAQHPPLAISGPTGAGKGTLITYLSHTSNYAPVVSDTTRPPRKHNDGYEVHGVNYHFVTENEALTKINQQAYVEIKQVHEATAYGTSLAAYQKVVESGRTPILEIDVQGVEDLMGRFPKLEAILLLPPSFEIWQQRLDGRGSMGQDEKIQRLKTALNEIVKPTENPRFHPVINTEVVDTAAIIATEAYKNPDYQDRALKIAHELLNRTIEFLKHA